MKKRGFTLIEIVVVLAVVAVIAAIAVPTAFGSIEKARTAACNANITNTYSQYRIGLAMASTDGTQPDTA